MGTFADVFEAENKNGSRLEKGEKGEKAPGDSQSDTLFPLNTLFPVTSHFEIPWPYTEAAHEPRCQSCRHWWQITGKTWRTGEGFGDCLLHRFETLELDNCKRHDRQQGSGLGRAHD